MRKPTSHQIRELRTVFSKAPTEFDKASEQNYAGMSMAGVGAILTAGTAYYRLTTKDHQKLQSAFKAYHYPVAAKEVGYLFDNDPMHSIVNTAIDNQAPHQHTQIAVLSDGKFVAPPLEGFTQKLDIPKFNAQVKADGRKSLDGFYTPTYWGMTGGVGLMLTGAFLMAQAGKDLNRLYNTHVAKSKTPAPSKAHPS